MLTKEMITEKGRELGFEDVGFTTADPFDEHKRLLQEMSAEYAWALGKIGGEAARSALLAARGTDSRAVDAEVAQALVAAGRVR